MAGRKIKIFGYLMCVLSALEGTLRSRINPRTQAAVTQSLGVAIVSTLISLMRLNGSGLTKVSTCT